MVPHLLPMEGNCRPVSLCALVSSVRPHLAVLVEYLLCLFCPPDIFTGDPSSAFAHSSPEARPGPQLVGQSWASQSLPWGLRIERESCRAQWSWTRSPVLGSIPSPGYGYRGTSQGDTCGCRASPGMLRSPASSPNFSFPYPIQFCSHFQEAELKTAWHPLGPRGKVVSRQSHGL